MKRRITSLAALAALAFAYIGPTATQATAAPPPDPGNIAIVAGQVDIVQPSPAYEQPGIIASTQSAESATVSAFQPTTGETSTGAYGLSTAAYDTGQPPGTAPAPVIQSSS